MVVAAQEYIKELKEIDGTEAWIVGRVGTGPQDAQMSKKKLIIEVPSAETEGTQARSAWP